MTIYEPKGRALEYSFLAINHYLGCSHGCRYCYASKMMKRFGRDFDNPSYSSNFIKRLKSDSMKYQNTNKLVLLSFTTDPYQQIDVEFSLTREVIKILTSNSISFQILTKGGTRAIKDFDLYGKNDAFATTLTFLDKEQSLYYEPSAAVPEDRISAIVCAKSKNINTWVSLEPVIDPLQSLDIIKETHSFVDLYKIGKLNHVSSNINWRDFGIKAIELCNKYNKKYYIKHDLSLSLYGIKYTNTDTRIIV